LVILRIRIIFILFPVGERTNFLFLPPREGVFPFFHCSLIKAFIIRTVEQEEMIHGYPPRNNDKKKQTTTEVKLLSIRDFPEGKGREVKYKKRKGEGRGSIGGG